MVEASQGLCNPKKTHSSYDIFFSFERKADLNGFNYFLSNCCPSTIQSLKYGQKIISKGTLNVCLCNKIYINADHKKWTAKYWMELIPPREGRSQHVHPHTYKVSVIPHWDLFACE